MSTYEEIKYNDFNEFYNKVVLNTSFGQTLGSYYAFRGESTTKYTLLPSAFRKDKYDMLRSLSSFPVDESYDNVTEFHMVQLERGIIKEFYKNVNNNGYKVNNVKLLHDKYLSNLDWLDVCEWIDPSMEEIIALAQHQGLPTRMLDWTFNINVALYFAAKSACVRIKDKVNRENDEDYLVIWAINHKYIEMTKLPQHMNIPIHFYVPHYYDNENSKKQASVLSYWKPKIANSPLADHVPLDVKLRDQIKIVVIGKDGNEVCDTGGYDLYPTLLYKFLIPQRECYSMMHILRRMGFCYASLFSGYSAIVEDMKEKALIGIDNKN